MDGEQNNVNMEGNMGGTEAGVNSIGPVVGIIVILVIIILGGLYFWNQRSVDNTATTKTETATALDAINAQSTADDTAAIETDLNSTQIENLDAQLNAS